jgi:hypothetical protein
MSQVSSEPLVKSTGSECLFLVRPELKRVYVKIKMVQGEKIP